MNSFRKAFFRIAAALAVGAFIITALSVSAKGDEIYSYQSADFGYFSSNGDQIASPCSVGDCYFTVSFDLANPLGDDLSHANITPSSFTFDWYDGSQGIQDQTTQTNATSESFQVSTDANGNITGWFISAGSSVGAETAYYQTSTANNQCLGQGLGNAPCDFLETTGNDVYYVAYNQTGTWSSASTLAPTPEPAIDFIIAMVVLGGAAYFKKRLARRAPGTPLPDPDDEDTDPLKVRLVRSPAELAGLLRRTAA